MQKLYHVKLDAEERARMEAILKRGKANAHTQRHARILLLADANGPEKGWKDALIAAAVHTCRQTVERVRKIYVEQGLDSALEAKAAKRQYIRKLDGAAEARLVAIACGPAPEGRARWTLRLLANELVVLEVAESISYEAVRRTLKKMKLNPGKKSSGSSQKPAALSS